MHRPTKFCAACQNGRRAKLEELAASFFMTEGRKRSVGEYSCLVLRLIQKKFSRCSMDASGNIQNKITG